MLRIKLKYIVLLMVFALAACRDKEQQSEHLLDYYASDTSQVQTAGVKMIPIKTPAGVYKVWTKRIGNNPKIKVLLLAGGPGFPHDYLEVFESFFPKEGIEFYYYDELGSGNSDKSVDSTRFSVDRAVAELEQVREALGLDKDNLYIFGHSWGGILAMEYALKYQQHVKGLIISNMSSSGKEFNRYIKEVLVKQLPKVALDSINLLAARNDYANPRYTALVTKHFYGKFVCRLPLDQWPEPFTRALGKLNQPYYLSMQGPSEFGIIGSLKNWDISTRLNQIKVPALMIGAKYDEMDPKHMEWMSKQVANGRYLYCHNGSHLSMYDQQQVYMRGIIQFLREGNDD
ncbi:proline iminopeptidase-family hydrolase [Dyadobacter chenwenxiniae]|uniref:Proline iminopeptidase-family hydrolase n=1 Tax=Dyadobacter chenwenxiniae TaxID=2906456 RepID=A0A9X1PSE7_9BACT|nr:proline iminopeptidase-family hydrolase [Dyadobacter chenwenxiniae]MCF0065630.1 proline iminopeptidase-family hydrolase [Dyadobacter chenwenxiniae]UON85541.1 proline iminopeptidase-family hydrolase [Dyadobacter chenwenxiniae]